MNYTNIDFLKSQLNIESGTTIEDNYLIQLLNVSESTVSTYTNNGLTGYTDATIPLQVVQATYMLATHLYLNRSIIAFTSAIELPYTFKFLLEPFRNLIIC